MGSFSMLLFELPDYLGQLGGRQYLGFIVGLFTLSAAISRFFSGRMSDQIGRVGIILFGSVVTTLCGVAYIYVNSVFLFLLLRFFHGMSTGFRPTASSAYMSDIVPENRKGEAMGYLGIAGNTGMALAPALGSWLRENYGFESMFIASSCLGLLALLLSLPLKETMSNPEVLKWKHLNIFKGKVLERNTWPSAVYLLFVSFAFGTYLSVSPDLVAHMGFMYKGLFSTVIVASSLIIRLFTAKSSDKHGRIPVLKWGSALLFAGMLVIATAQSKYMLVLGGLLYGASAGINMPAVFAWTTDLSHKARVGMGLATMLLALELGIMMGALVSASIYDNKIEALSLPYYLAASMGLFALLFLSFLQRRERKAATHVG